MDYYYWMPEIGEATYFERLKAAYVAGAMEAMEDEPILIPKPDNHPQPELAWEVSQQTAGAVV